MNKKIFLITVLLLGYFLTIFAQHADTSKVHPIEEITVSAYRTTSEIGKIPYQLKIIQTDQITSLPVNSLDDLLKKNASIDVVQYPGFNSTVSMRGFYPTSSGNTLILMDGIPVGTENISTLNLNNARQIEILKGPFSSFFGSSAMSGVINISSKRSKGKIAGGAAFSYGSYNTYKIDAQIGGRITQKFNFDIYASSRAQLDNYRTGNGNLLKLSGEEKMIMDEKSFGSEYKNTKYKQYSVGGRLGFQITDNLEINLNQEYWIAKDIQTNGTFWGVYGPSGKDINRWSQSISFEGKAGNHQLRLTPWYSNENSDYYNNVSDTSFKTTNYNYKTYGFVLQDAFTFGAHRLIFGVDNTSKKYVSKQWADADSTVSPYQPDYLNSATGIYAQLNVNFWDDNLNVTLGGRYDNITFKLFKTEFIESEDASEKYNVFNPNFGVQYKFPAGFKIHSAVGTAFMAPDAFKVAGDYTTSGFYGSSYRGNPDLKPESSITTDFGLSYNNKKLGLNADVTCFTTNYKDMVVYDYSNLGYTTFANANEAHMDGLEVLFEYDLGALKNYAYSLKFYVDYTHLYNAKIKSEENNITIEEDMKYVRMNKAAFGISYNNNKGFSTRLNARYIGMRDEDNWLYNLDYNTWEKIPYQTADGQEIRPGLINETVLKHPDFLIIDLSVSYIFKKNLGIGFTANNLFDDNYTEKDAYYMPGRNYMATVSYKF